MPSRSQRAAGDGRAAMQAEEQARAAEELARKEAEKVTEAHSRARNCIRPVGSPPWGAKLGQN